MTKTIKFKLLFPIILLTSLAFLLFQQKYSQLKDSKKTSISIAVSHTPLSAPFFIAQQQGFFSQHNLDVTLVNCSGGVRCMKEMFSGHVDYSTASETVAMFNRFNRQDFNLLSSFVTSTNDIKIITKKSNNITRAADLLSRPIGAIKSSASEFYLDTYLLLNNINPNSAQIVFYSPEELSQALLNDDVVAISTWEPHIYNINSQNANLLTDLSLNGIYQLNFNLFSMKHPMSTLSTTDKKLLDSLRSAIDWISNNDEETQQIIADKLSTSKQQIAWTWGDYFFHLSLSNSLLANIELQARWALEKGRIPKQPMPNFRDLLTTESTPAPVKLN
ncbi:ABC transporter substrate-binding protein [Vibrio sp. HB161653]|nr:ABC transporter substrate-binding protein [Vibrio sp. HB161653]MDP5252691.1 ABC transporter substrate-binding protein [Vibrio sp. HB161653]